MWLWFVLFSFFEYESSPYWFSGTTPFVPFITLEPPLSFGPFQKSRSEECRGRPVIDRKRKFLDTDLAHDSEGSETFPLVCGFFKWLPVRAACRLILPVLPSTRGLILVSSVFNSRIVSGSQSTSRGLVS